jgi:hypothetical protein
VVLGVGEVVVGLLLVLSPSSVLAQTGLMPLLSGWLMAVGLAAIIVAQEDRSVTGWEGK